MSLTGGDRGRIARRFEAIVLAAAITAGSEREAAEPESILRVNLLAQTAILTAARQNGGPPHHQSILRLAYGANAFQDTPLNEETACDPVSLYPSPNSPPRRLRRGWPRSGTARSISVR